LELNKLRKLRFTPLHCEANRRSGVRKCKSASLFPPFFQVLAGDYSVVLPWERQLSRKRNANSGFNLLVDASVVTNTLKKIAKTHTSLVELTAMPFHIDGTL
jgi:hypothetical protein